MQQRNAISTALGAIPESPTPLEAAFSQSGNRLPIPLLDLSAEVIRNLPLENVSTLLRFIADVKSELATLNNMIQAGMELRYAGQARAQLLVEGRDTGTTHIIEGEIDVTIEIGKDVKWDQTALKQLARRIAEGGEDPTEYIEVKYAVSERKYAAWPDSIGHAFTAARTVTPKSPKFSLRKIGEGA